MVGLNKHLSRSLDIVQQLMFLELSKSYEAISPRKSDALLISLPFRRHTILSLYNKCDKAAALITAAFLLS